MVRARASGWRRRSLGGKVFFANSGAEANEAALKLARKRTAAAATSSSPQGAFHGRTYGALSATPQETKQAPFAPLVPGLRAVGPTPSVAAAVNERTAAVLIEPIQGETGVHAAAGASCCAPPRGVRRARRGADLRRDPDRHGADGDAVGLRADAASCPTR